MSHKSITVYFDHVIYEDKEGHNLPLKGEPMEGAIWALNSIINSDYQLVILTDRPAEHHSKIVMWLKNYIPGIVQMVKEEKVVVTNIVRPTAYTVISRGAELEDWEEVQESLDHIFEMDARLNELLGEVSGGKSQN